MFVFSFCNDENESFDIQFVFVPIQKLNSKGARNKKSVLLPFKAIFLSLLEIIANSDRRHGLEFDCNQEASLS